MLLMLGMPMGMEWIILFAAFPMVVIVWVVAAIRRSTGKNRAGTPK